MTARFVSLRIGAAAAVLAFAAGCTTFSRDGGFGAVSSAAAERLGQDAVLVKTDADRDAVARRTQALLSKPLGIDDAVQIALLNNRGLQASYAELGLSEADLVQAGRLPNPGFTFSRTHSSNDLSIGRTFSMSVLSMLTLPLATKIEARRFEQTKLETADAMLKVAADTRRAYVEAGAAAQAATYAEQVKDSADAGAELALRMRRAGNFSRLDYAREQAFYADAVAQLVTRAQAEQRDLVSLMVRLRCDSFWEKALIPAFVFFFAKLYPFSWINDPRNRTAGAAGGCMLVRRDALEEAGGIESIRGALIDDCSLAAQIKHRGAGRHPIRLDLADRSVSLRPYDSWRDIWNMIARTAFTQLRYSPVLLLGTLVGMTILYLVPPVAALAYGARAWPAWLAWASMCTAYAPMLSYYRRSPWWAPALPLVALFYVGATFASAVRYWRGKGGQWKARVQAPVRDR